MASWRALSMHIYIISWRLDCQMIFFQTRFVIDFIFHYTVCPGSSDPPEKIFNIFASENEVLHHLLLSFILGHMNYIG